MRYDDHRQDPLDGIDQPLSATPTGTVRLPSVGQPLGLVPLEAAPAQPRPPGSRRAGAGPPRVRPPDGAPSAAAVMRRCALAVLETDDAGPPTAARQAWAAAVADFASPNRARGRAQRAAGQGPTSPWGRDADLEARVDIWEECLFEEMAASVLVPPRLVAVAARPRSLPAAGLVVAAAAHWQVCHLGRMVVLRVPHLVAEALWRLEPSATDLGPAVAPRRPALSSGAEPLALSERV